MAWQDIAAKAVRGFSDAAGNSTAADDVGEWQDQRQQKRADQIKETLAPLVQASQAAQTRLALFADPNDPTKAVAGKEAEYGAAHDQLADIIGKMRTILHPPPADDPHGLSYLAHRATDKLHITRDLAERARDKQTGKVEKYNDQTGQQVQATVQGIMPPQDKMAQEIEMMKRNGATPEQIAEYKQEKWNPLQAKADNAPTRETGDTRARADFDAFKKEHPEYKGTFEQWKTEQAGLGRSASKPVSKDDRYISIEQKRRLGQELTPEEKAYSAAYDIWTKKTKIDPGIARAAAFGANRFVPVMDPQDPSRVILMRAADASKAGVGTPASIAFQTDKAVTRAFTAGKPADTINYFNTATDHLKLLKEAADALQNGNIIAFNRAANAWSTATGNAAPTNFDSVRNAVAGELSKTFRGASATNEEINLITGTINNTQSPDQLHGSIDYYLKLMDGKMEALKGQYEAGKQGKPNFPNKGEKTYKQTATGPNNHKIGSNDGGVTWYDVQTGKQVK